jgi:hypothetical protein
MKQVLTLALAVLGVANAVLMPFGPIWHLVCVIIGVQAAVGFVTDKYPNLSWVNDIARLLYWGSRYYGKKAIYFIKYKL